MALGHHVQELVFGKAGQAEDFFGLHAQLLADFLHGLALVNEFLDNGFHRLQQVGATGTVVGYGAVHVGALVAVVVYDYDRHFAAQQGQQRLPARYSPAMEAVNDGAVRAYHDGQCPAVGQDRLDKQLQVFLADLVGVVVVGVNSVAVYPLEGCQRGEYINAFHGSAPP